MSVPEQTNKLLGAIGAGLEEIEKMLEMPEGLKHELVAGDRNVRQALVELVREVARERKTETESTST